MKMHKISKISFVVFLLGCFLTNPAKPDDRGFLQIAKPAEARRARGGIAESMEQGIMLNLGLGLNGCTDRLCHDVLPMVDLQLAAIFRFKKNFGIGLHMGFLFGHPKDEVRTYLSDLGRTTFDSFWLFVIAPEFRLFLPHDNLDFWVGVLPGYARWMADGVFIDPRNSFDASMNGFVIGYGGGVDYYFTEMIALGAAGYFYHPHFEELCYKEGRVKTCYDLDRWHRHDIGMWWTVGFKFTAFFGF